MTRIVVNQKAKISGKKAEQQNRHCLICGSDKTNVGSVHPVTGKHYPRWHRYKDGYICNTCRFRMRYYEIKERQREPLLTTIST